MQPAATGGRATGGAPPTGGSRTGGGLPPVAGQSATGGRSAEGGSARGGAGATREPSGGRPADAGMADGGAPLTDRCGRPTQVTVPTGYTTLAWHDEFDTDGAPASSNWGYEQGFVRNEERQWYQAANAAVSGGELIITAKRESKANPAYQAGSTDWKTSRAQADYTSASLTSSGKRSWQYGRFELCARIPVDKGTWPAWWTLGTAGEWPANGEIDIMEAYQGKILANIACGTSTRWQAKWDSVSKAVDAAWAARYHLWRMDWTSTAIDLYIDDQLLNSAKLSDMLNADGTSPFKQKAYMILNLAIGGTQGGEPAGTTFPQTYAVDYVRVFQ